MRHDDARYAREGYRAIEVVRLDFTFHFFDHNAPVVQATELERGRSRHLES